MQGQVGKGDSDVVGEEREEAHQGFGADKGHVGGKNLLMCFGLIVGV